MRGLVLFLMAGYDVGIDVYDSVVFQKVNEITSTRAKWLVTFVYDLQPFQSFVKTVGRDVYKAIEIAKTLRNHFKGEQQEGYLGTGCSGQEGPKSSNGLREGAPSRKGGAHTQASGENRTGGYPSTGP